MKRLFSLHDFRVWFLGTIGDGLGMALVLAALPFLLYELTGSTGLTGTLQTVMTVVMVLVSPLGGVIVDGFDRRRLMMLRGLLGIVLYAAIIVTLVTGVLTWQLFLAFLIAAAIVSGLLGLADEAAMRSIMPSTQLYAQARPLMEGSRQATNILGKPLGGFLYGVANWVPFLGAAIGLFALLFSAFSIRANLDPHAVPPGSETPENTAPDNTAPDNNAHMDNAAPAGNTAQRGIELAIAEVTDAETAGAAATFEAATSDLKAESEPTSPQRTQPETDCADTEKPERKTFSQVVRRITGDIAFGAKLFWNHPQMRPLILGAVATNAAFALFFSALVFILMRRGYSAAEVAILESVSSAFAVLAAIFVGKAMERIRISLLVPLAAALVVACLAAAAFWNDYWQLMIIAGCIGLVLPFFVSPANAFIVGMTPVQHQGKMLSVMGVFGQSVSALMPLVAGILVSVGYGATAMWLAVALNLPMIALFMLHPQLRFLGTPDQWDQQVTTRIE